MDKYQRISLVVEKSHAIISLNRQGGGNALDLLMVQEFNAALTQISENENIKALLIRASGKDFCVGGDLEYIFSEADDAQSTLTEMVQIWHQSLLRLTQISQFVIVATRGAVAGGGIGLVLAADHVIASKSTAFCAGFSKLGLTCDSGLSWFLPRQVGPKRAKQILLSEKAIDAEQALDWGLVDELVEERDVRQCCEQLLGKMSAKASSAIPEIKKLLSLSWQNDLSEQFELERKTIVKRAGLNDVTARVSQFLNK